MAIIVAVRSGNWSDTSHVTGPWPGASTPTTKPGVGDTVQAGEFVVEIDEDATVALLESTSTGYFRLTSAPALPAVRTITGAIANSGTAGRVLEVTNPSGLVFFIGDVTGGSAKNAYAIYNSGGTIGDITGDVTGGSEESAYAIYNSGVIGDITGDVTAGDANNAYAVYNDGVIGDITGDVTAGDANNAYAVYNGHGTIGDITGDMTAGDAEGAYALYNDGGTIGDITGSLICGATGQFPINGPFRMVANPANSIVVRQPNGAQWTLSNDYPAEADVKSGVDYNRGTMTGELAAGGTIGPVSIVIGGGGIRIF